MARDIIEIRKEILKKQCEFVGADFDKLDFVSEGSRWFMEYSWTEEIENKFKDWFKDFLSLLPKSEYYQVTTASRNKSNLNKLADEWCFNYGWTYTKQEVSE